MAPRRAGLRQAAGDEAALRARCTEIMRQHASTQERLPILADLYGEVSRRIGTIHSVMDVACGFNPLAVPWMPLAPGAKYLACDIYRDMIELVGAFLALAGADGRAFVCDVVHEPPAERVHLALILKTIPCLEQVDKAAGLRLLDAVPADYVLVSFPARSLGGRDKGMIAHYEARLGALLVERHWPVQRFEFETELAFLVDKRGHGTAP